MRHILHIATFWLLVVITAGCQRMPLYDAEANLYLNLEIDYEIENASEVPVPELIMVNFYDIDTHNFLSHDFTGPQGGPVHITPGTYDILVYNFDTEYTIIHNEGNLHTIEANTNRVSNEVARRFNNLKKVIAQNKVAATNEKERSRGDYSNDPLINQPDYLFVGIVNQQEIPNRYNESDVFKVHVKATTVVETFLLEITDITGIENISAIDAFITGQIECVAIGREEPVGAPATIHVPVLTTMGRSTSLTTTFNTFGKYPDPQDKAYVLLNITDTGGQEHVFEFDVTDQFLDKENNGRTITVSVPITIEPPKVEGGGLSPSVTQWDDEQVNIII